MKQKFRKLTFVKVCDEMPRYMSHFHSGFVGIVDGTYSQIHGGGGRDLTQYCLFRVKDGKVVGRGAWYDEDQLTEMDEQDSLKAEEMIEEYQTSR